MTPPIKESNVELLPEEEQPLPQIDGEANIAFTKNKIKQEKNYSVDEMQQSEEEGGEVVQQTE